jgi:hypothetical protein
MLKHRFLYYFDYGDSHEFEIQVVGALHPAWGASEGETDD